MNIILLIIIGSLVAFSAVGFLLYSSFTRKAHNSIYWLEKQSINKKSYELQKDIYYNELRLKAHKELIVYTVKCRNMTQKISVDVNNLLNQLTENIPVHTMELQLIEMLCNDTLQLISELEKFETTFKIKLEKETSDFLNRLILCMKNIQEINQQTIDNLKSKNKNPKLLSDYLQQLTNRYNQIVEMHQWIINHFQKFFETMQAS